MLWFDEWWFLRRIARRQESILNNQTIIYRELRKMAKVTDEIKAFSAKIDAATDAIAARLQKLIDSADSGLTDEAKAILQEDVDRLEALGKDPAAPVPTEPPA
jgi:hypothetical protein